MSSRPITLTTLITMAAALVVAAGITGCGSSATPASAPSASSAAAAPAQSHNQADIAFATAMIPHHVQAVTMSKLATSQANSPQLKDLASRIQAAQQPEIDQMTGMLRAWNAPVPNTNASGMGDMDHGGSQGGMPGMDHGSGGGMPGMMSSAQMQQLGQAHGAAFDKIFLQMMIGHHQGAITMSKTQLADGQNPDAKALARRIIDAQQREITEMQNMLSKL